MFIPARPVASAMPLTNYRQPQTTKNLMPQEDLRFALIGHGLWGTRHARAIAKTAGARLVAIAATSEQGRQRAQDAHPAADVVADYRQLLARDDIDVVDVVAPNHLHHEMGSAALEAGKHLLLEKPMALSVEHCDDLIRLAEEHGRIVTLDHEMRLSSLWGRVKQMIDEDLIGTPQYVMLELSRFPYRQGSGGWRFDIHRVGNWILEEPIHFFDLARWYMSDAGAAESVYARANSRQPDQPELQDNFTTIVNFSGGGFAVISQTLAAFEHHVTCKVTGEQGAIWANWSAPDARSPEPVFGLRYSTDHTNVVEIPFEKPTGEIVELELQIAAVVRSIRDGAAPIADAQDGKWAVALCLAAQRSVDLGHPVDV